RSPGAWVGPAFCGDLPGSAGGGQLPQVLVLDGSVFSRIWLNRERRRGSPLIAVQRCSSGKAGVLDLGHCRRGSQRAAVESPGWCSGLLSCRVSFLFRRGGLPGFLFPSALLHPHAARDCAAGGRCSEFSAAECSSRGLAQSMVVPACACVSPRLCRLHFCAAGVSVCDGPTDGLPDGVRWESVSGSGE